MLSWSSALRWHALTLSGDGRQGAMQLRHINFAEGGKYTLRIQYTRNGLEDK
jgi:hypothetical protein